MENFHQKSLIMSGEKKPVVKQEIPSNEQLLAKMEEINATPLDQFGKEEEKAGWKIIFILLARKKGLIPVILIALGLLAFSLTAKGQNPAHHGYEHGITDSQDGDDILSELPVHPTPPDSLDGVKICLGGNLGSESFDMGIEVTYQESKDVRWLVFDPIWHKSDMVLYWGIMRLEDLGDGNVSLKFQIFPDFTDWDDPTLAQLQAREHLLMQFEVSKATLYSGQTFNLNDE